MNDQAKHISTAPCATCKALGVPCGIESDATTLRTRRGQTLAFATDGNEAAFIVRAGVFTLHLTLPGRERQLAAMFFPGDLLLSSFAPSGTGATFASAGQGEVWRIRFAALEEIAASDPGIMRYLNNSLAKQIACRTVHAAMLAQLDCEQRVATLLVELALRTGSRVAGGGVAFELPFDRKDVADFLGLNPDTLSRIMSRLRSKGLVTQMGRGRAVIPDLAALAARSPAASSLFEINSRSQAATALGASL